MHNQVNNIAVKLGLLKIKNYVKMQTLRNIYFAIFGSHLTYSCIPASIPVNGLVILLYMALQIMNFKEQLFHLSPIFFTNNILRFAKKIALSINQ